MYPSATDLVSISEDNIVDRVGNSNVNETKIDTKTGKFKS